MLSLWRILCASDIVVNLAFVINILIRYWSRPQSERHHASSHESSVVFFSFQIPHWYKYLYIYYIIYIIHINLYIPTISHFRTFSKPSNLQPSPTPPALVSKHRHSDLYLCWRCFPRQGRGRCRRSRAGRQPSSSSLFSSLLSAEWDKATDENGENTGNIWEVLHSLHLQHIRIYLQYWNLSAN